MDVAMHGAKLQPSLRSCRFDYPIESMVAKGVLDKRLYQSRVRAPPVLPLVGTYC
jgi:hypothetical protein